MKKESIWIQGIRPKVLPPLKKRIKADILIVGGGLAGISTAFELAKKERGHCDGPKKCFRLSY